jgi:RNA-directed DNA polymerase
LQHALYRAAKADPGRRFHSLRDKVYRRDVLWRAWVKVRRNNGAAGIDKTSLAMVEEYGVARLLDEVASDLREGGYRPLAARRVFIPKPGTTEQRPLSIPTVRDRVVQAALKIVLEPIFEADMLPCSFGFRPQRATHDALQVLIDESWRGRRWVVETDIANCFEAIPHQKLMQAVEERVCDQAVLKLLRAMLRAGVMDGGQIRTPVTGTPQGGVISPLLANIFLHAFDRAWAESGTGELVRYADDFVVLCTSRSQAEQAHRRATAILGELGLVLHPDKTRVVDLRGGREGFDFLGWHFHACMSGRLWEQQRIIRYYLHRWPSQRSMKRARLRVKVLTDRRRVGIELNEAIGALNLFLRGWGNYFRTGNSHRKFRDLDRHVTWRLKRLLIKKRGRNLRAGQADRWTEAWFHDQGLHKLMGTIRYPKAA